jgi:hypothetical protein
MATEPLAIHVQLHADARAAGKLVITNRGSADVRFWQMGNSWGDGTLSFEVKWDGRTERVTRKPQDYTRNVPSSISVAPGGKWEVPFDLADGTWEPPSAIDRLETPGAQLVALYEIRDSPEARTHHVWLGRLRSESVALQ